MSSSLVWLTVSLSQSAWAAVSVGSATGPYCATVPLPITIYTPTGAAGVLIDLAFEPSALVGVGAAGDRSLGAVRVDGYSTAPGRHRVLVWTPDNRELPARFTVSALLYIAAIAPIGIATNALASNVVTVAEVLISDAVGGGLRVDGVTNGFIRVVPGADTRPPTLTLEGPSANARIVSTDGLIPLRGRVTDNIGVCAVHWRLNGGPEQTTLAITNWVAVAPVGPGLNRLEAHAVDGAGNVSPTVTRSFVWVPAQPFGLDRIGQGVVTGLTDGQILEIGKAYSINATPARGWLFGGWSGGTNSDGAALRFVMRSNFALRATFVTNAFPRLAGAWHGLAQESVPRPGHAGLVMLNLTPMGATSGKLMIGSDMTPFQGQFRPDGNFRAMLRNGAQPLQLDLAAPLSNPAAEMTGTLTGSTWTASVLAFRNPWTGQGTNVASGRGAYTALVPGDDYLRESPSGDGALSISISPAGLVRGAGTLGDLTAVTFSSALNSAGRWPLYISLDGGRGLLMGWVNLTASSGDDLAADALHWLRPASSSRLFPEGFTNVHTLSGSRYQIAQPVLRLTNAPLQLAEGNLAQVLSGTATMGAGNRILISGFTNGLVLNLIPGSGLVQGDFTHPATGRKTALRGAVHQKQNVIGGAFAGTNRSGWISIGTR